MFINISSSTSLYCEIHPTTANGPRPWLVVVHPAVIDVSFIRHILCDPGLRERFSIFAADSRWCGRTKAKNSATEDLWTWATDIVMALDKLGITKAHLLGTQAWLNEMTMRMLHLYPERFASIALCGLASPVDPPEILSAFSECVASWTDPQDPEDYDEVISAVQYWLFGPPGNFDQNLLDRWAIAQLKRYPPSKATNLLGFGTPLLGRSAIPSKYVKEVTQPMLLFNGTEDQAFPLENAQERAKGFINVPGGAKLEVIKHAPCYCVLTHWEEIQPRMLAFYDSLDVLSTPLNDPIKTDFAASLKRLSEIAGDPSIAKRDPTSVDSFYITGSEAQAVNQTTIDYISDLQLRKFSMFGGGGKESWENAPFEEEVVWRFSGRFDTARLLPSAVPRLARCWDNLGSTEVGTAET